jgi:hypothetical protein
MGRAFHALRVAPRVMYAVRWTHQGKDVADRRFARDGSMAVAGICIRPSKYIEGFGVNLISLHWASLLQPDPVRQSDTGSLSVLMMNRKPVKGNGGHIGDRFNITIT